MSDKPTTRNDIADRLREARMRLIEIQATPGGPNPAALAEVAADIALLSEELLRRK